MYTMQRLCKAIGLAEAVTEQVLFYGETLDFAVLKPATDKLRQEESWEQGLAETRGLLGDDQKGFKMLTCMLHCALECWEAYQKTGLSDEIFIDTMACFTRFTNEHFISYGCYGFDRAFWTVRQVSGKLFRIGQLEYELLTEDGKNVVSLHIPSDADLRLPLLRQSYDAAKVLIDQRFPDFAGVPYVCGSWLLSPNLKDLLPAHSRILAFQRSFDVQKTYSGEEFKEWVYKRTDIPNADLPENTSLQRNLKAFLLSGGTFLSGEGPLIEEPFR